MQKMTKNRPKNVKKGQKSLNFRIFMKISARRHLRPRKMKKKGK